MPPEITATTVPSGVEVPDTGTPGRLRTRILDKLMVKIARSRGDQLWLLPVAVDLDELRRLERDPLVLECAGGRGLLCIRGEAEVTDSGMIRFRVIDAPEVIQRRRFVRVPVPQPVSIIGLRGVNVTTRSINLSGGGMLLEDLSELILGDRVHFQIELDGANPPINGWATVVRLGENGQRGFEFEQISRRDRDRLIHFIFDRQRQSRNPGRAA